MFVFDKYLSPFLTPLGLGLVLLIVVLLLLALRRSHLAGVLLLLTTLGLYTASTPFAAHALSGLLERQYLPQPVAASPSADAIIVLGGTTRPRLPPRQDPDLNGRADRIMHAADLYRAGKAPVIVVSGGSWRYPSFRHSEADDMRDVLMRFGVPASAILLEDQSEDTAGNARLSTALMQQHGLHTALLVTSGIHMPRAMAAFRRAGLAVTASATDIFDVASPDWHLWLWLPSPKAMVETDDALHELVGLLYYRLRGWA